VETRPETFLGSLSSGRAVWGDLDTIIMKAMRKEPDRRYGSVADLRADLQRHRSEQPIRARPLTLTYQVRKFTQRHRLGVGMATVLLGVLTAFFLLLAEQRNEARVEAEKAKRVSEYLSNMFRASRPDVAQGETITATMLLDYGQQRLPLLRDAPAVRAQMLSAIGSARLSLGQLSEADSLLAIAASAQARSYGPRDERTLDTQIELASTWIRRGQYERADSLLHRVLLTAREAKNESLAAVVLNDLGNSAERQSDYAAAEAYHREALALRRHLFGPRSEGVAASLNNVGRALHSQDRLDTAERYYRDAMKINAEVHGPVHPETSITLRNLAELLQNEEQFAEADSLLQEVLRIDRAVMPRGHPRIAEDLNDLGALAARRGHYAEAEAHFRDALRIQHQQLGSHHPHIALSYNNLAYVLDEMGQTDSVLALRQRAVAVSYESLGPDHVRSAIYVHGVGVSLYDAGRLDDAEAQFQTALSVLRAKLPDEHRLISHPLVELGRLCLDTERPEEAEMYLREELDIARSAFSPHHPQVAKASSLLQESLARQGVTDRVEPPR